MLDASNLLSLDLSGCGNLKNTHVRADPGISLPEMITCPMLRYLNICGTLIDVHADDLMFYKDLVLVQEVEL